jgi:general stress protein YciG
MSTKKRGFASMDPAKQREIASKGGKAAHQKGTAHEFTTEEAREAGRKGGQAAHGRGTAHKFTSEEAREAGRKGGRSARGNAPSRTTAANTNGAGGGSATAPSAEAGTETTACPVMPQVENAAPDAHLTPGPSV